MTKMKNWVADYAVRFKEGNVEDYKTDFQANTIREALDLAERHVFKLVEQNEEIEKIVIWNIGIKELDVF